MYNNCLFLSHLHALVEEHVCLALEHTLLVDLLYEGVAHIHPVPLPLVLIARVRYVVAPAHAPRVAHHPVQPVLVPRVPRFIIACCVILFYRV